MDCASAQRRGARTERPFFRFSCEENGARTVPQVFWTMPDYSLPASPVRLSKCACRRNSQRPQGKTESNCNLGPVFQFVEKITSEELGEHYEHGNTSIKKGASMKDQGALFWRFAWSTIPAEPLR